MNTSPEAVATKPPTSGLEFSFTGGSRASRLAPLAVGAPLDLPALAAWVLGELPNDTSETPYEGIRATLVEAEGAGSADEPSSVVEASTLLRTAIRDAIERSFGGAKRVAVMAGGGVDSAAVLALAVEVARARGGTAFGVALDYRADGDDRPHLRVLEAHLGCEVVRVPPEAAADRRPLLEGVDAAPFNVATAAMEIEVMARARALGAEVVLTGAGGDELFDGEPRSLARLVRRGRVREAVRAVRALRGFDWERRSFANWLARPLFAPHVPARLRLWNARRAKPFLPEWAAPVLVASRQEVRRRALRLLAEQLAHDEAPERAPSESYRVFHAWRRHQSEVVSRVARRDPFVDRTLVRFVHQLPPEWLLLGDVRRGLFREAMRGLLPESLRTRDDKASFEPAMVRWVESIGGFDSLRDLATMHRLAALGLVEPTSFARAFDELARAPITSYGWGTVWPALCVEAFLRARARGRS